MPRRMSVSLTLDAVKARTKTVTRRKEGTWATLKPGDRLTLIEKGMGLAKGEKQVVVAEVEITDVRDEPITRVTQAECVAEGFPHMTPVQFVRFWLDSHGHRSVGTSVGTPCRRIEWRYLDG